jgi:endonuclease G, mitochondrial
MNQEQSLQPQEEFVFGSFTSPQLGVATQVPIRSIEAKSGISFGKLAAVDPLSAEDESIDAGGMRSPLAALEHIRFLR